MLMISVPKTDIEALGTTGVQVRINGEEVILRRQGNKLLYGDEVRIIFDCMEQDMEVFGMSGVHPCVAFFAGEADTEYISISPRMSRQ